MNPALIVLLLGAALDRHHADGVLLWPGCSCNYHVTWAGRYVPAAAAPCSPAALAYLQRWAPTMLGSDRPIPPASAAAPPVPLPRCGKARV